MAGKFTAEKRSRDDELVRAGLGLWHHRRNCRHRETPLLRTRKRASRADRNGGRSLAGKWPDLRFSSILHAADLLTTQGADAEPVRGDLLAVSRDFERDR